MVLGSQGLFTYVIIGVLVTVLHMFALRYDETFQRYKRRLRIMGKKHYVTINVILTVVLSVALWPVVVCSYSAMALYYSISCIKKEASKLGKKSP